MSQEQDPYFDLDPQRRVRLGMLTPSSNTVVEPIGAQMLAQAPWIAAHFQRFRVTAIRAGAEANAQFAVEPMLGDAQLLADAEMNSISWNGTSALGLDLTDNYQIAKVRAVQLVEMTRAAAKAGCEAILVQCTNLAGAPLVEALERETGVLILDSVAVTLWGGLRAAGVDPGVIKGWGRLFREFA